MKNKLLGMKLFLILLIVLFLVSCGGGGGETTPIVNNPTTPSLTLDNVAWGEGTWG